MSNVTTKINTTVSFFFLNMATFCVILKINSRKQHRKRQRPLAKGMIGCLCRVSQYCVYGQIMLG